MDVLRALILFLVFFVPSLSQADTIPAIRDTAAKTNQYWASGSHTLYPTPLEACQALVSRSQGAFTAPVTASGGNCFAFWVGPNYQTIAGDYTLQNACPAGYSEVSGVCERWTCPAGQGWSVNGQSCTRPDCAAYQTRDSNGLCTCPAGQTDTGTSCATNCPSGYHPNVPDNGQCTKDCEGRQVQASDGSCKCNQESGTVSTNMAAYKSNCVGGCAVSWSAGFTNPVHAAEFLAGTRPESQVSIYSWMSFNGSTCSPSTSLIPANVQFVPQDTTGTGSDNSSPEPLNKPETNKSPESCAGVGGSYAVVNGVGKCLSSAGNTMDAPSHKITTQKETQTTTNPDGSQTKTEKKSVQVTDPSTGQTKTASSSTTVVIAPGGATTAGPSTSIQGEKGKDSDLCTNNPGLDLCQNRLAKEETLLSVKGELEKLNAGGDDDFSALTNAKATDAANDQLITENQNLTEAATGVTDVTQIQRSSWQQAMEDGWFSPVSVTGCTPFVLSFAGRSVTIDHCEKAALIASILEYALWFSVVVGTFVMFTGGAVRSS